jgi:hypothetical protein
VPDVRLEGAVENKNHPARNRAPARSLVPTDVTVTHQIADFKQRLVSPSLACSLCCSSGHGQKEMAAKLNFFIYSFSFSKSSSTKLQQ